MFALPHRKVASRAPFLIGSLGLLAVVSVLGVRSFAGQRDSARNAALQQSTTGSRLLLFSLNASGMERDFLRTLPLGQVRVVSLSGLDAPEARRHAVRETPTLVRLSADGAEAGRCVGAAAIAGELTRQEPIGRAASCPAPAGPRLKWVEEDDRRAAWVYRRFQGGREGVPEIYKAMSLRPELMEKVLDLSERAHFSDGYLDHKTKERIATLVSSLNRSPYCTASHAAGLQDLGASSAETVALVGGDIEKTKLSPKHQALLQFARRLTRDPGARVDQDIQRLRALGWRDEQIFEAAFDVGLFNFFNRMAATYRLSAPTDGWQPQLVQARAGR